VPTDDDQATGWVLVVVPPSHRRPHAVVKGDDLRYSRRHGSTTRHLSEAEVADLYRDRFATARADVDRAAVVHHEGVEGLDPSARPVLSTVVVPAAPGRMIIDTSQVQRVKDWLGGNGSPAIGRARFWLGFFETTPDVWTGHRRIVAAPLHYRPYGPPYCELHGDGAGYAALPLYDIGQSGRMPGVETDGYLLASIDIAMEVARMLRLLGSHAQLHTGAYGDALVVTRLDSDKPCQLGWRDHHGFANSYDRQIAAAHVVGEFTLPVDALASDDSRLLAATWTVSSDLVQSFGQPEIRALTREGGVRPGFFTAQEQRALAEFAEQRGVVIDASDPPALS
jgi:hypothetical protein